jgi:hypothetical protein
MQQRKSRGLSQWLKRTHNEFFQSLRVYCASYEAPVGKIASHKHAESSGAKRVSEIFKIDYSNNHYVTFKEQNLSIDQVYEDVCR